MSTQYYCCSKCKTTGSYAIDEETGETTFPRGEFLAHRDFLTTGMRTKEEAEDRLTKDIAGLPHD
jgi:hypothetical protein